MTDNDNLQESKGRHYRKLWYVHGQMHHLCLRNRLCNCKNNAAAKIMARNFLPSRRSGYEKTHSHRAIAVGASYSDPIRVAAMLIQSQPWDTVIIVGDRQGPLYDNLPTVKTPSELPTIESFDRKKRNLVIFDECGELGHRDLMIMEAFAIRSRLYNVHTLFVECDADHIPAYVRKNTDALYLTTAPRSWTRMQRMFNCVRVPAADCFAGADRTDWLKIDLRNEESEVIDASKYYP